MTAPQFNDAFLDAFFDFAGWLGTGKEDGKAIRRMMIAVGRDPGPWPHAEAPTLGEVLEKEALEGTFTHASEPGIVFTAATNTDGTVTVTPVENAEGPIENGVSVPVTAADFAANYAAVPQGEFQHFEQPGEKFTAVHNSDGTVTLTAEDSTTKTVTAQEWEDNYEGKGEPAEATAAIVDPTLA